MPAGGSCSPESQVSKDSCKAGVPVGGDGSVRTSLVTGGGMSGVRLSRDEYCGGVGEDWYDDPIPIDMTSFSHLARNVTVRRR